MPKNSQSHDLILLRNVIMIILVISFTVVLYRRLCVKEEFKDQKVKIVLFWAEWCRYCEEYLKTNIFMDTYKKLENKDNVLFVQLDYEKEKSLANQLNITSFPTIVSVDNNYKLIDKFVGNRFNENDLINFVVESEKQVSST